jgi:hypothetical protein
LIVAIASQYVKNFKTFTVKFSGGYDESLIAASTSTKFGAEHHKLKVSMDLKNDVEKILLGLHSISNNIIIILLHKPSDKVWVNELISNDKSSYVFPSYPTESILDVAAIVDAVDLVITPDTSIVHMACALNKPLIAIYKRDMEGFEAWKPKSKCNYVVFSEDFESLNYINIDTVINKSLELIKMHIKKEL